MTNSPSPILVGTRKGLFTFRRDAGTWRAVDHAFAGDPVTMVLSDGRTGDTVAALRLGHFGVKLHRRARGAAGFQETAVPEYPPMPDGITMPPNPNTGRPTPWKLDMIWELAPAGAPGDRSLWCGTIPGGLFRSHDGGATWALNRSLWDREERLGWFGGGYDEAGIHSIAPDPRAPRSLLVGVSCGGIWRSDDDGGSWRVVGSGLRADYMPPEKAYDPGIQDPHLLVRCPAAPDRIWVQHHNGIFRSDDGADTFVECGPPAPSGFGFAVAVHPRDPDTAWFVPAQKDEKRIPVDGRLVVLRTRDGGRSFTAISKGLPSGDAWDLVYRHALAVDDSGEIIAFGSTTGSLWISEDSGTSWSHVTAHLPPINVVRFAART